jgi:hypothetical protein
VESGRAGAEVVSLCLSGLLWVPLSARTSSRESPPVW